MSASSPQNAKVARARERMRAAGLRPVQFWVPDTRAADFAAEMAQQCLNVNRSADEAVVMHLVEEAAQDTKGWR